jgi:hypothetical protein
VAESLLPTDSALQSSSSAGSLRATRSSRWRRARRPSARSLVRRRFNHLVMMQARRQHSAISRSWTASSSESHVATNLST